MLPYLGPEFVQALNEFMCRNQSLGPVESDAQTVTGAKVELRSHEETSRYCRDLWHNKCIHAGCPEKVS